ncbi:acyltransferase [Elizabethkingia ursingii]
MSNLSAWDSYTDKKYSPSIEIGNDCSIGEFFNLSCINGIVLGNNVLIGRWVTIIDHSHGYLNETELQVAPAERDLVSKGKIIIDDNVWIGDKVTICPNVHIHKGAIIGANSVVTYDVEANTIVAGCPARVIKTFNNKN